MLLRWGVIIAAFAVGITGANANWNVEVEEAAFGQTEARATSSYKSGAAFFFECVNNELAFGMVVVSRNDEGQQSGMATVRVMVDEPPHEDFEVDIGSTIGGMLRLTSRNPDDAERLAFKVMSAKKSVDTGVLQNDGGIWLATKRSTRGAKNALARVLKACNVEIPSPPEPGTVLQVKDAVRMPWLTLCMYDKKPGVSCNCELIDQDTCRFTAVTKRRK
jgi:hypothetical protein